MEKLTSSVHDAKTKCRRAFSSWDAFKKAVQVKDTLATTERTYVDADPLWMNEGALLFRTLHFVSFHYGTAF